jgi:5'-phosphate synthase pdxT subunit
MRKKLVVGILALQGAFALHVKMFHSLGVETKLVKKESDLENIDAIVIPGGESTVLNKLLDRKNLKEPLCNKIENGLFAFGTCAGLILLAQNKKILDCEVIRNAYGTQKDSFITKVDIKPTGETCEVAFIRAPKIASISKNVEILATYHEEIVGVMSKHAIGVCFHNEVTNDNAIHRFFVHELSKRLT